MDNLEEFSLWNSCMLSFYIACLHSADSHLDANTWILFLAVIPSISQVLNVNYFSFFGAAVGQWQHFLLQNVATSCTFQLSSDSQRKTAHCTHCKGFLFIMINTTGWNTVTLSHSVSMIVSQKLSKRFFLNYIIIALYFFTSCLHFIQRGKWKTSHSEFPFCRLAICLSHLL